MRNDPGYWGLEEAPIEPIIKITLIILVVAAEDRLNSFDSYLGDSNRGRDAKADDRALDQQLPKRKRVAEATYRSNAHALTATPRAAAVAAEHRLTTGAKVAALLLKNLRLQHQPFVRPVDRKNPLACAAACPPGRVASAAVGNMALMSGIDTKDGGTEHGHVSFQFEPNYHRV